MTTIVINGDKVVGEFFILDVSPLIDAIMAPTVPNRDKGITHPGNWPSSAEFGISYKCRDRQFDVRANDEQHFKFFETETEVAEWLEQQADWIKGTDNDFSIQGSLYKWDLGPEYVRSISL